jgi:hypothetical protein
MNFKKFSIAMALLAMSAVAQKSNQKPVDDTKEIGFSQVRGCVYNSVANNLAGGLSVCDVLKSPSQFADKKFFYTGVEVNGEGEGYVSFGEGSKFILGYSQSPNSQGEVGLMSLGYAASSFGLTLNLGLGMETHTYTDQEGKEKVESTTYPGNIFALTFSMPLSSNLLSAHLLYTAFDKNYSNDVIENVNNEISLGVSFGNTLSNGDFFWEGGLRFDRYISTEKDPDGTKSTREARSEVYPYFNIGYTALKDNVARVAWGFNNTIFIKAYDQFKPSDDVTEDHSLYGLQISPNILGEILINDNLIAFGEVVHNITIASSSQTTSPKGSNDIVDKYTYIQSNPIPGLELPMATTTAPTEVAVGLRLQGERAAIEARLANGFYRNIFQQDLFHGAINGFIYF